MSEEFQKLDELHEEIENNDISNIHVDRMLWKIGELEKEIEDIKYKQMESKEFYDRRIDSINKQISYRENLLEGYMQAELARTGNKTSKLPNGTLKMMTRTTREFGDDDALIKFSYDNNIPTRVTEKPDKKLILSYIQNTADTPSGYFEKKETPFSYKTNNEETK